MPHKIVDVLTAVANMGCPFRGRQKIGRRAGPSGGYACARATRQAANALVLASRSAQPARTFARNFSASLFNLLLSADNSCADESIWPNAIPVSDAPRLTSEILRAALDVSFPAYSTLRMISWVAASCSATAAAMASETSETWPIVLLMSLIADTVSLVAICMS